MSILRSYQIDKRRMWSTHARVRLTAQPFAAFNTSAGNARLGATLATSAVAALGVIRVVGVQLVRPVARRLPLTDATPSSSSVSGTLSCTLAPVSMKASGKPLRSVSTWRFVPALRRSVGFAPVAAPPFCRDGPAVHAGPAPADAPCPVQAPQQLLVQAAPHTGFLPVAQPPSARHARVAAFFPRGSISKGRPERSTNKMPVSAARFDTRGRPPLGLGRSAGSSGSTLDQSSSVISALFIPPSYARPDEFLGLKTL